MTPRQKQKAQRQKLFLKGPIYFEWIQKNIPDPASRVILIAEAFRRMSNGIPPPNKPLTAKIWDCADIKDKHVRSRVLNKIDAKVQGYKVERRPGRTAVLWGTGGQNKSDGN